MWQRSKNPSAIDLNFEESRALGAYWGLAVGDALGATVEFQTPSEIRHEFGVHDKICGGGWLSLKAGQVTDDTTMALALGNALVSSGKADGVSIASAFDQWMRAKPVDIGHTVRRGIIRFRSTGQTSVPLSEFDAGNGACMRVLPLALATLGQPKDEVESACAVQSHVTHNNPLSDAGTFCIVRMIQMAIQGASLTDLLHGPVQLLVDQHPVFRFRGRLHVNPSGYIVHTLKAVFQSLFDTDKFQDCLIDVVNRGGDADTTGAIAGVIAGALYGVEAIPQKWLRAIDPKILSDCELQALSLLHYFSLERS